jgi:pyrroline-5-carboxylate reductase
MKNTILLCGYGNMGSAMVNGWLKGGMNPQLIHILDIKERVAGLDPNITWMQALDENFHPDIIVISVKPNQCKDLLLQIKPIIKIETLLISVVAGKESETFNVANNPVVRIMPNTPAAIGLGNMFLYASLSVSDIHKRVAVSLVEALGEIFWLQDEDLMHAVTAISGSGPAYIFYLIKLFRDKLIEYGISESDADRASKQLFFGATKYGAENIHDLAKLIKDVTSPGGTTEAALKVLKEDQSLDKLFGNAFAEAIKQSIELSK